MNDPPSFGIEEEYFLVHPRSGTLVRRVPARFIRAAKARCGDVVTSELLQSQVEIASPVFHETDEASATLFELRRGLADIALDMGYRLIAAGTHPVARWQRAEPTRKPRYQRLIDDFKIVGRRNLLCGLHLHVAVPPTIDRVALMNRLLPWLPVFLALSTSSPFWQGARTGLLSYRQAAYDEWPRAGAGGHSAMTRRIVEENRWRAKRYGIEASFIDEHGDEPVPLAHVLDQLRDLLSEDAQALGCEKELARLTRIMALGTSAHQQLAVFDAQRAAGASVPAALRAVVDWLVQATVEADPE
jgi:gamma-glutamyl:cysteine ligase YbdK (ATP-grasp superfamily)